jgi:signal transduction histidine kinase
VTNSSEHKIKPAKRRSKNILIADDEETFRYMLTSLLEAEGYKVYAAVNGVEAINMIHTMHFDVALLDVKMPKVDGVEVLKFIQVKRLKAKAIILTAVGDVRLAVDCMQLGAWDYITKPFSTEELLFSIDRALRASGLEGETHRLKRLLSALRDENTSLKDALAKQEQNQEIGLGVEVNSDYKAILGSICHNLRNEFATIGGLLTLLRDDARADGAAKAEYEVIGRSLEYSQFLVSRLLTYLDMTSARTEPLDLRELLVRVSGLIEPRLSSNTRLRLRIDQETSERIVMSNSELLMGILIELIHNAAEAMQPDGGTITLSIDRRDGEVAISVKDEGPGIPDDLFAELFARPVRSEHGLGIGLYLSGKVIRSLGGKIKFERLTKGSKVTIFVPKAHIEKGGKHGSENLGS